MTNERLERVIDLVEIKDLLVREKSYRDSLNWTALREVWHPDASRTNINISWYNGDIDGFIAGSKVMAEKGPKARHDINPVEVHFSSNNKKASSESNVRIRNRTEIEGTWYDITSYGRFINRLEKYQDQDQDKGQGQKWYMVKFEAIYDNETLTPTFPTDKIPSTRPPVEYRESYNVLAWMMERTGFPISQDMPGLDRPETVERIMQEAFAWLKA